MLPGLATWLGSRQAERGPMAEQSRAYWREAAMELSPATLEEAVWLDLALLVTGNSPRTLSRPVLEPQLTRLLAQAWGR